MHVQGDKYLVFYSLGAETVFHDVFDSWQEAKASRNDIFFGSTNVRAAWVMKRNPSLNTVAELYGGTLRQTKHEAGQ